MSPLRRTCFALATLAFMPAVAVLFGEGVLRALHRPLPVTSGWRAPAGESLRLQRNQLGFRGQPIEYSPDDFVTVLVGDSQVEAMACSYYWMPERSLQRHAGAERRSRVFSIGAGGYGQDQQLLALREYFERFRADAVVVWETPGNDLWNNTFPTADPEGRQPKPTFWLENGVLHGPTSRIGEVASSPLQVIALMQARFRSRDAVWEKRLPPPYEPCRSADGPVNTSWQSLWDENLGTLRSDNLSTEKSHQTIYLTPRSARTQYSVDLTHQLLLEMSHLAHAHGAAFLTFWVDSPHVEIPEQDALYSLNGRYYHVSNRQRMANMADVNSGFDTCVLPVPAGDWRVSPTDGHLNEHAVDEVMAALTPAVVRSAAHTPGCQFGRH